ncbi:MAG: metalloregulator ArsR/SmtB family transcription factor [Patescibacteria group bacterium]|nr:metalloregulator ArsR/SmtB family transcription factor [Patescibacteria group bacterium]
MKHSCPHEKITSFFKAVCDSNRHKILYMLKNGEEMNASKIIDKLRLSQPAVAHHLKILVESGVLSSRKDGKETYYRIDEKKISDCCHGFVDSFCKHGEK